MVVCRDMYKTEFRVTATRFSENASCFLDPIQRAHVARADRSNISADDEKGRRNKMKLCDHIMVAHLGNSCRSKTYTPHVENTAVVMMSVITVGPMPAITKSLVFI